jgi:arylsulfatase A-like enzyme
VVAEVFVEDFIARESVAFLETAVAAAQPFVLWHCTQVPHMDHRHTWPAEARFRDRYDPRTLPLSPTWNDDLAGKPPYLATSRSRTQALAYGYEKPEAIRAHTRDYYAAVEQMDASLGHLFAALDRLQLRDSTWILFMADNGWMMGDHGFTSKVLPYEESIRVPMIVAGPGVAAGADDRLVLGIDLTATMLDLAGLARPPELHGRSLLPLLQGRPPVDWRRDFLYEAPESQLGSRPLWAVRTEWWKYIETRTDAAPEPRFRELYDLQTDPHEIRNLAADPAQGARAAELAAALARLQAQIR